MFNKKRIKDIIKKLEENDKQFFKQKKGHKNTYGYLMKRDKLLSELIIECEKGVINDYAYKKKIL